MEKHQVALLAQDRRPAWSKTNALYAALYLVLLYNLASAIYGHVWPINRRHDESHLVKDSPYGPFPKPDDPFQFIPCTSITVPPALEDANPKKSWSSLFDPDPSHWSWGKPEINRIEESEDPYSERGIYLCGWLDVPLDYSNKSDVRITRLAVTKFQVSGLVRLGSTPRNPLAGKKSERTLVVEPGGPGGSGTSFVWRAAEDSVKRFTDGKYDVLGWDPRGVNTTVPSISCFPYNADRDRWALQLSQYRETSASPRAQLEFADAMYESTLHACWEQHGDLGRFMGTSFVARDLEEIRKAIGEDELTGYLISYGTGIGQTYANMFPDSVGRMILDGTEYVRDHRLLGGFGWTALDNGTDAWRDGFIGECVKAGPGHCALAQSKHGEEATAEGLDARMHALFERIIERPIPGYTTDNGPSLITYSQLVDVLYSAMYNAVTWPALAKMLYELEGGNSTLAVGFLQSWEYDPTIPCPTTPGIPSSDELEYLVICGDAYDAPQPEGLDWWLELWTNMTTKSWIAGNSRFRAVFPCRHFADYWPNPAEAYRGDLNNTLKNPVLLIAETHDPATPLRNGRRLLDEMGKNARLIVHHGYGHSSRDQSQCTNEIAKAFLLNGTLPEEAETACYADGKPYLYDVKTEGFHAFSTPAALEDPISVWHEHQREMATLGRAF